MKKWDDISRLYFWLLLGLALTLIGLGLGVLNWTYGQGWGRTLWHVCQGGLNNLSQHLPLVWQLAMSAILALVVGRGTWSLGQQIFQTRRFVYLLYPLERKPPARLRGLLETHNLPVEKVVYLDVPALQAFCLGYRSPRIWLTAGLVDLLSDEELTAVLAHEAYHCQHRDPLRLLISRAIKSAFVFLPLVSDLAEATALQQETAADQSAIRQLGDDLPLLSALQKLLRQGIQGTPPSEAALTYFNVTEARLRRLIYPSQTSPFQWQELLAKWSLNMGVIIILGSVGFLSTRPLVEHREIRTCAMEEVVNPSQTQLPLSGW